MNTNIRTNRYKSTGLLAKQINMFVYEVRLKIDKPSALLEQSVYGLVNAVGIKEEIKSGMRKELLP